MTDTSESPYLLAIDEVPEASGSSPWEPRLAESRVVHLRM